MTKLMRKPSGNGMTRPIDDGSQTARTHQATNSVLPDDASGDPVNVAEMLVEMREATKRARSFAEGWVDQRNKMTGAVADFESAQMRAIQTLESVAAKSAPLPSQRGATKAE